MSSLGWFWHHLDGFGRSWAMVGLGDRQWATAQGMTPRARGKFMCHMWSVRSPGPCHWWPRARCPMGTRSTTTAASGNPWGVLASDIGGEILSSSWKSGAYNACVFIRLTMQAANQDPYPVGLLLEASSFIRLTSQSLGLIDGGLEQGSSTLHTVRALLIEPIRAASKGIRWASSLATAAAVVRLIHLIDLIRYERKLLVNSRVGWLGDHNHIYQTLCVGLLPFHWFTILLVLLIYEIQMNVHVIGRRIEAIQLVGWAV